MEYVRGCYITGVVAIIKAKHVYKVANFFQRLGELQTCNYGLEFLLKNKQKEKSAMKYFSPDKNIYYFFKLSYFLFIAFVFSCKISPFLSRVNVL